VIVQFGGQTPLTLALPLKRAGRADHRHRPGNIDLAEDRKRFGKLLDDLDIPSPPNGTATSVEEACDVARASATPCWCGPATCWAGAPW
jgi:carbamoyl-phosphate synthase large subunit